MNEKEEKEFYIAMCNCCLISQEMKTCPLCRFNIGLAEQVKSIDPIPLPISAPVAVFVMSEAC